jgi:membrane-bound lytic murein transglycosylase B
VDIPKTALEAYGYAEWVLQQTRPDCKLQWTTLAAVGKITTDHGRSAGGALDAQARVKPAIIGPVLSAADTDAGALDGDQAKDHAVGPMQLTPSMWRISGVDGDSDKVADPQDLDDAALSAAYQLCDSGGDLSVVANWKKAINAYHALAPQIEKIFETAQTYGTKSKE